MKKLQMDRRANCLRPTGPFESSDHGLPAGRAQLVSAGSACAKSRMCHALTPASLPLTWQEDVGGSGVQGQPVSKISK